MPPPNAPAENICISITPGNTSAMPASASVPSWPTQYVSISPVAACANMISTFGQAIRSSSGTIGPCSNACVRGFIADGGGAGATARVRAVLAVLEKVRLDQRGKPRRQDVRRHAEALAKLLEAGVAVQRITQDQDAPPFADPLERAGDRTVHFLEAFPAHVVMV